MCLPISIQICYSTDINYICEIKKKKMNNEFAIVAKTLFGLEEILINELEQIGAKEITKSHRAVFYKGNNEILYKSNLLLRTAIRILKPIKSFEAKNEKELYAEIQKINWEDFMTVSNTFAIDGTTSGDIFTHSKYVSLLTKDAIVDKFRDKYNERPSVEIENPDIRINLHIKDTTCNISLDSSGSNLGKRGYKLRQVFAPLSEVLAAGMVLSTGWDGKLNFIDPMCGSGTIPIEAALIAKNIAPGSFRNFAFENWADFDKVLWNKLKTEAKNNITLLKCKIFGFDNDTEAISISKENAVRAGIADDIIFKKQDFLKPETQISESLIIMNPPYGERLMEDDEIIPFYKEIGDTLKLNYNGCDAWILSGNLRAIKFVGLKPSRKIPLFNGPIECRLNKFELYRGSKKG